MNKVYDVLYFFQTMPSEKKTRKKPGIWLQKIRSCPGIVPELSQKKPGILTRTLPGIVPESTHFRDNSGTGFVRKSGTSPDKKRDNSGKGPGQNPGQVWTKNGQFRESSTVSG